MAPGASGGIEFEVCDLTAHHLTDHEKNILLHHVGNLGYVTTARIYCGSLFITADFGKLEGNAFKLAHGILVSRAKEQVARCKAKPVRIVQRVGHSK